jgi:hypothetical protein
MAKEVMAGAGAAAALLLMQRRCSCCCWRSTSSRHRCCMPKAGNGCRPGYPPIRVQTSLGPTTHHIQAAVPRQAGRGGPGLANNVCEGASAGELGDDAGWIRAKAHELNNIGMAQRRQKACFLQATTSMLENYMRGFNTTADNATPRLARVAFRPLSVAEAGLCQL